MPGLYLHIPFCTQACSYCDFYFVTQKTLVPAFVESLCKEIRSWKGGFGASPVETIYFGGGTPSVLSREQLGSIFNAIHETFDVQAEEITLEANPEHITREFLKMVCNIGITRLSMGVQSFDSMILSKMHRAHDREQAQNALKLIKEHTPELQSWSADLIYGNPGQSLEMLEADIEQLLSFDPPHISTYSLTLEDRTRLNKEVELGRTKMPDQDRVAEHAELVSRRLHETGYEHYEVSSYAKPGHRAVHNHRYWNQVEYLGFGPSAHSFLWESWCVSNRDVREMAQKPAMALKPAEATAIRWAQPRDLKQYLSKDFEQWQSLVLQSVEHGLQSHTTQSLKAVELEIEPLTLRDLAEERIMLAFRTRDGLTTKELRDRYRMELSETHLAWLEQKQREGLIEFSDNERTSRISLTEKGLVIADHLTVQFISI